MPVYCSFLVPLIVGYLLPRPPIRWLRGVNRALSAMVYVILFLMGISLAFLPNLASNLLRIGVYTAVSALCILAMNVLALGLLEKALPWRGAVAIVQGFLLSLLAPVLIALFSVHANG